MKMSLRSIAAGFLVGTLLAPIVSYADMDTSKPATIVKESVITTKIKTKLAAEYPATATQINVDTDETGTVWLRGSVASSDIADKAFAVASSTEGVRAVKSELVIKPAK